MNYGDKHTEDSLCSRLGRLYGIERGLDCGPNIIMDRYWKIWDLQKSSMQKRRKTLKSRLRRILPMNFCQYII